MSERIKIPNVYAVPWLCEAKGRGRVITSQRGSLRNAGSAAYQAGPARNRHLSAVGSNRPQGLPVMNKYIPSLPIIVQVIVVLVVLKLAKGFLPASIGNYLPG